MKAVFRCDASATIGHGHVSRCLTLADDLAARGARVSFVCREQDGDLNLFIERRGYLVHRLEGAIATWEDDAQKTREILSGVGTPDWLIVDHYGLDHRYERALSASGSRILVIDDLADRPHHCDLLLDQNLYQEMESRYHGLIPAGCRTLLGPRYALLRPEFIQARRELPPRSGALRRILISFGGSDPSNETAKALSALDLLTFEGLSLDVVAGSSNPRARSLETACAARPGCTFHGHVDTMAQLMSGADLALGSGGTTTWERCYLGLPSLTVVVAPNQLATTEAVAAFGATRNLGWHADLSPQALAQTISGYMEAPEELARMSARAFALMGQRGWGEHPLVPLIYGEDHDPPEPDAA